MASVTIEELKTYGIDPAELDALERAYPGGTVTLHPGQVALMLRANVLWMVKFLSRAVQIELAKAWYDRALVSDSSDWKATTRALLDTPDESAATAALATRKADIETLHAAEQSEAIPGVGWGMARFALLHAQDAPPHDHYVVHALVGLAGFCRPAIVAEESSDADTVLASFKTDVLTKLDANGVTAPPA